MNRKSGLPTWLKVILGVVGVVVLGPPALALLLAATGIAFSVTAGALKLAVIGLGVYALVLLVQAVFGKASGDSREDRLAHALNKNVAQVDRMDEERRALDQEWERAVADARKSL